MSDFYIANLPRSRNFTDAYQNTTACSIFILYVRRSLWLHETEGWK